MASSRPSKFTVDSSSPMARYEAFTKYAETCFLPQKSRRRRNSKCPIGVLSFGDGKDSGFMEPLPTEALIKWDVDSNGKSSCSDENFASSHLVEASLSWLINANGEETEEDESIDDELSMTLAFAKNASTYDYRADSKRNSKPPNGVLNIRNDFEDDNGALPSEALICWVE